MVRIGVLVSGGGTNLQAILDAIGSKTIENAAIVSVVSNREDAFALKRVEKHKIQGICISPKGYTRKEYSIRLKEHFKKKKVDLIILAGFMVVLEKEFVQAFPNRIMNIHPSLIPAFCGKGYYGLKVHEAALKRGVKITGATVHFVDEGTDTGPIILQKAVEVKADDTPETLQKRVMEEAEWIIYPQAVELFVKGKLNH